MALAIKAENVSKAYRLGEIGTGTLAWDIQRWYAKFRGKDDPFLVIGETNDRTIKGKSDIVWSLKDISFEVEQGDAVGIIGRNGAGKSTLLKLLSRVTSPTTGSIKLKGRIASLLEVGTGFHPELTGRENVFLNGAILGMRKKEILNKFDEILDFSGVERYIDTPVKRYSSGMYVRLAFAVAAYLDSEILIVDEVLAVGDAEFQQKCLGRMKDVSEKGGRTVLFVSHNMAAIANLCPRAVFLSNGMIRSEGPTSKIIEEYISYGKLNLGEINEGEINYEKISPNAYFNSIRIVSNGKITSSINIKYDIHIELEYTVTIDNSWISPSIHILDNLGTCIIASFNATSATLTPDPFYNKLMKKGKYKSIMTIPGNLLNNKHYRISTFLCTEDVHNMAIVQEALSFSVTDTGEMSKEFTGEWWGLIRPKMQWNTVYIN